MQKWGRFSLKLMEVEELAAMFHDQYGICMNSMGTSGS
jgi:hypothetical protein